MTMIDKPVLDSNILIYSANADSLFYEQAYKVIEHYAQEGFWVTDINLVEFFQVVTDGRKTSQPFSPAQATEYINKLVRMPEAGVLKSRSMHEIVKDDRFNAEIKQLNICRFEIYDHLIADCMRMNNIQTLITANDKDFKKYDFIQAINPFSDTPRTVDHGPRTTDHGLPASDVGHRTSDIGLIPYGKQSINEKDIAAVCSVLRSDMITQGPKVPEFEQAVADYCGVSHAVAANSGTSVLHLACRALELGPGDTLWTSPITFVASANCALYCGADVDFVDIDPYTYNISVQALEEKLQKAETSGQLPKAVVPVHMCGQPCEMEAIHGLSEKYGFRIIEDACHAVGARYKGEPVGNCRYSDIAVFSFHPVKIITTGEGGMAVTGDAGLAERMRLLREHGISRSPRSEVRGPVSEVGSRTRDLGPRALVL